jgi:UDP-N-acetylglucosamine 1-carboxyvinyltransferase
LLKLEESGCKIEFNDKVLELTGPEDKIKPVNVTTSIFPGFPTDMQAQWTAYMALADGISKITDTIFIPTDLSIYPNWKDLEQKYICMKILLQ